MTDFVTLVHGINSKADYKSQRAPEILRRRRRRQQKLSSLTA